MCVCVGGVEGVFERKHTFFSQFIFTLYKRPGFRGGVVGLSVIIKMNKFESRFSRDTGGHCSSTV